MKRGGGAHPAVSSGGLVVAQEEVLHKPCIAAGTNTRARFEMRLPVEKRMPLTNTTRPSLETTKRSHVQPSNYKPQELTKSAQANPTRFTATRANQEDICEHRCTNRRQCTPSPGIEMKELVKDIDQEYCARLRACRGNTK